MTRFRSCLVLLLAALAGHGAAPAAARDLLVGPKQALKLPSQAAAVVKPGDVVRIEPGEYDDCAVWKASDITIQATGPQVVLAGKTCWGKGIFVVVGNNITIDGITFREATVPEHNGAGIRVDGENLTVRNSRFERNENGILAGGSKDSVLRISDSFFIGNGACIKACAHGVYAGMPIKRLEIDNCRFLATKAGHHIKSRAHETIVRNSRVEDGIGGTSSYLIEVPVGGDLLVEKTIMQKGPNATNHTAAISIGAEGTQNHTNSIVIKDNNFRNEMATGTAFVRNATQTPAHLIDNHLAGNVRPLEGLGTISP